MKTNSIYYVVSVTTSDIYDECNPDRDLNVQTEDDYPKVFTSKEDAEAAYKEASKISNDYGRELMVELWDYTPDEDDIADIEDEDELNEYINDNFSKGNLILSEMFDNNHYEPLAGGVVLTWSWHRYIGYARNFVEVEWGDRIFDYSTRSFAKTEKDLITNNGAYTNRNISDLIIKADELKDMTEQDKAEYIINKIMSDSWKWNYQQGPSASKIADALGLNID